MSEVVEVFQPVTQVVTVAQAVGPKGDPGRDGIPGLDGLPGADGRPGADGKDGLPGRDGVDGAPGEDGAPGRDGIDGADGLPGRDGADGAPGRDGTNGVDGARGLPGAPGRDGTDGLPGDPGPGTPTGGTTGQVLAKASNADHDTHWIPAPTGGSGGGAVDSVNGKTGTVVLNATDVGAVSSPTITRIITSANPDEPIQDGDLLIVTEPYPQVIAPHGLTSPMGPATRSHQSACPFPWASSPVTPSWCSWDPRACPRSEGAHRQ